MIRVATPADAEQLAGVQHRAWWRAYAEWVDPELFGTVEARVARWQTLLAEAPGLRRTTLLHDQDGRVAGFVALGPARDPDTGASVGELFAFYVDPPAQGAGVGGALLAAAEQRLAAEGYGEAVLWVFARNGHARAVYERRGWTFEPGSTRADRWSPEVRYRRPLAPPSELTRVVAAPRPPHGSVRRPGRP